MFTLQDFVDLIEGRPKPTARDLSFRSNLSWAGAAPPKLKLRIKPSFVGGEITAKPTEEMKARRAALRGAMRDRLRDGPPIAMPTAEELAADLTKVFASATPLVQHQVRCRRLHDFAQLLQPLGYAAAMLEVYGDKRAILAADILAAVGEG